MGVQKKINIQNKKARFEFEILDKYTAGIQLTGTEIQMVPVKNPGRQGLKTKLSTKTYWPAVYIVEHRIKNCSHFLHSPTGYEKTQREIAQEMYI